MNETQAAIALYFSKGDVSKLPDKPKDWEPDTPSQWSRTPDAAGARWVGDEKTTPKRLAYGWW